MGRVILEDVSKIYEGGVTAVRNLELNIHDGEFLVLVGPSGCGKSTTLRMIAGLENITSGTINISGRMVNNVPPKDRNIAMVFQNYALYPHMSVYENMGFGLRLRKFKKKDIECRVREAAGILGITDLLDRRPAQLSGGQRQRVAVGRAIVRKPDVFLFDEPLSNLDAGMRVRMRAEIGRLHKTLKTTMIYVTHDQAEAMTMGDRIVVMKDGVVQQIADPVTLYDYPANRFVAGFIGTPPMNFFEGEISEENGKAVFKGDGMQIPVAAQHAGELFDTRPEPVVLGLRPEDIGSATAEASADAPRIKARIDLIEPMGAETYLHMNAGKYSFISRVDPHRQMKTGSEISLAVLGNNMRFFDPENGKAVACSRRPKPEGEHTPQTISG